MAKVKMVENVTYSLKDKKGNIKKMFKWNWLGSTLKKIFNIDLQSVFTGKWVENMTISNLVTTVGKAAVADRLGDVNTIAAFDYVAVGTGTTAANVSDTALETEITDSGLERTQGTATLVTTDTTNDTLQLLHLFSVTGTKAITEAGVLNAASSGTLLARQVFSAVNVVSGDSFQVTWQFDID